MNRLSAGFCLLSTTVEGISNIMVASVAREFDVIEEISVEPPSAMDQLTLERWRSVSRPIKNSLDSRIVLFVHGT